MKAICHLLLILIRIQHRFQLKLELWCRTSDCRGDQHCFIEAYDRCDHRTPASLHHMASEQLVSKASMPGTGYHLSKYGDEPPSRRMEHPLLSTNRREALIHDAALLDRDVINMNKLLRELCPDSTDKSRVFWSELFSCDFLKY